MMPFKPIDTDGTAPPAQYFEPDAATVEACAKVAETLRSYWSFSGAQVHTHTWHTREDFIEKVLPGLLNDYARSLVSGDPQSSDGGVEGHTVPNSPAMTTPTLREALERCDHTLTAHGHIDANTPLHDTIRAALSSPAPDAGLTEDAEIVSNLLDHYLECYNGNRDALAHSATDLIHRLSRQPEAEPAAWGDSEGRERPIDAGAMKQLRLNPTTEAYWSRFSIPLYISPRLDREKINALIQWVEEELLDPFDWIGTGDSFSASLYERRTREKWKELADAIMREMRS